MRKVPHEEGAKECGTRAIAHRRRATALALQVQPSLPVARVVRRRVGARHEQLAHLPNKEGVRTCHMRQAPSAAADLTPDLPTYARARRRSTVYHSRPPRRGASPRSRPDRRRAASLHARGRPPRRSDSAARRVPKSCATPAEIFAEIVCRYASRGATEIFAEIVCMSADVPRA